MAKLDNRCANCGGKLGLVCHHHWGLRFCRKDCRAKFLARTAKDHARVRRWFGLLVRRQPEERRESAPQSKRRDRKDLPLETRI
jgi:hypothetical protein